MEELHPLIRQIQANCDVSDARYAGLFSVCGLALRLRDLYKWEQGVAPWEEPAAGDLLGWIGDREERWAGLAETELTPLTWMGRRFDPFDARELNRLLGETGFFYGAGYAYGLKPTFFLAPIRKRFHVEGIEAVSVGKEAVRDLLTLPAMAQGGMIVFRKAAAMAHFWDQMVYLKKSGKPFLQAVVARIGGSDLSPVGLRRHCGALFAVQEEIYLRHEVGELVDEAFDPDLWREIVAEHSGTPVELLARAVKDLLADTHPLGVLPRLVSRGNAIGAGLYAAMLDGLMRPMAPAYRTGCEALMRTGSWKGVEAAVAQMRSVAEAMAGRMEAFQVEGRERKDPQWTRNRIETELLAPLLEAGPPA